MRFLIVEDDQVVQAVLQAYLAHYAADCGKTADMRTMTDSRQALEEMQHGRADDCDAVFLDVRMPGMGGDDIYSRLMQKKSPLLDKIIFITGHREELCNRFPALKLNVLDKPFRYRELQDLLAKTTR